MGLYSRVALFYLITFNKDLVSLIELKIIEENKKLLNIKEVIDNTFNVFETIVKLNLFVLFRIATTCFIVVHVGKRTV